MAKKIFICTWIGIFWQLKYSHASWSLQYHRKLRWLGIAQIFQNYFSIFKKWLARHQERRSDYVLKFNGHHWLENSKRVTRIIKMENLREFFELLQLQKKKRLQSMMGDLFDYKNFLDETHDMILNN